MKPEFNMEELEAIWNTRSYERNRSYTRNLAAVLQPCSYADFNAHPDFDEAFQRWTQNDPTGDSILLECGVSC